MKDELTTSQSISEIIDKIHVKTSWRAIQYALEDIDFFKEMTYEEFEAQYKTNFTENVLDTFSSARIKYKEDGDNERED